MMMALTASAFRPMIIYINGTELASSTKYLPDNMINAFLEGAIWAPVDSVSDVYIQEVRCQGDYSYACFVVKYKYELKRPDECYVITYQVKEPGIIDAVLAYVDGDIALCNGASLHRDLMYRLRAKESKCVMTSSGFDVTRNYSTLMGSNGGPSFTENGSVMTHYEIDNKGKISRATPHVTSHAQFITEPNGSIPGREVKDSDTQVEEYDNTRTLGPGMQVLHLVGTPLHEKLAQKDFDDFIKLAEEQSKQLGANVMSPIIAQGKLWQTRAKNRKAK